MKRKLFTICLLCILLCTACGKESAAPKKGSSRTPGDSTPKVTATATPEPTGTPSPTDVPTETPTPVPTDMPADTPTPLVTPGKEEYIDISEYGFDAYDVVSYYLEIGMSSEYSNGTPINYVRKWMVPIKAYIGGCPRECDLELIQRLFDALNDVYGFPGIDFCDTIEESSMEIYFLDPVDYFPASFKAVGTDITDGYSTIWFTDGRLTEAEIGIRTDLTDTNKNHVILEEIVQALGLQNDSYSYPDSLYYQGYNEPQWPTDLDWLLVRFLYRPEMRPLMSEAEVLEVAEQVFRN